MTGFPFPSRPGRELGEALLDALLNGQSLPQDAPEQACVVAEMLADLAGPAEPGELAGETAARSAIARCPSLAGVSLATDRPARRRRYWLPAPRAGLTAALIVAAVGGSATAAYADALPGPIQNFAHHVIGAPPAHRADRPEPHPGQPRQGQPGAGKTVGPRAHAMPGAATPGRGEGHGPPPPSQAHGKARDRAEPIPPRPTPNKAQGKSWFST
jgi:hypothetical protein